MHSPMFSYENDSWNYSKKLKLFDDYNGIIKDYTNSFNPDKQYVGRGYFNAALINWNYYRGQI